MSSLIPYILFGVTFIFTIAFLVHVCYLSMHMKTALNRIQKEIHDEFAKAPLSIKHEMEHSNDLIVGGLTQMTDALLHQHRDIYTKNNELLINALDNYTDATVKVIKEDIKLQHTDTRSTNHRKYHRTR